MRPLAAVLIAVAGLGPVGACAARRSAAGPGPATVVLLADPDTGTLGRATVTSVAGAGTVELAADRAATTVSGRRTPPPPPAALDAGSVDRLFGETLSALPQPPRSFTLHFRFESDELTDESRVLLPGVLQAVASRPAPEVGVVGHTDTIGDRRTNYALGLERANMVRGLLTRAGVDGSLIDVSSHGETDLQISTADEVAEPRNRRVEISVR